MHIKGWVRSTLVDYPGRIAASLFCGGCNFRCPNCHNAHLVLRPDDQPDVLEAEIWTVLEKRRGLLDGIVISGGEPTLQRDLLPFATRLHDLGYLVKLDTNGYLPDVLRAVIDAGVVDYVALDIKAPLEAAKYAAAVGMDVDVSRVRQSVELLRGKQVTHEFRTTVVPGILTVADVAQIARHIAGAERYYLQQFVPRNTLDPEMMQRAPYLPAEMRAIAERASRWVGQVELRGV